MALTKVKVIAPMIAAAHGIDALEGDVDVDMKVSDLEAAIAAGAVERVAPRSSSTKETSARTTAKKTTAKKTTAKAKKR